MHTPARDKALPQIHGLIESFSIILAPQTGQVLDLGNQQRAAAEEVPWLGCGLEQPGAWGILRSACDARGLRHGCESRHSPHVFGHRNVMVPSDAINGCESFGVCHFFCFFFGG